MHQSHLLKLNRLIKKAVVLKGAWHIQTLSFFGALIWSIPTLLGQTANFTADVLTGCSPLTVRFTDLSTGPVNVWSWDFGNGNGSTFDDVIAVYPNPGVYTVTLTVLDSTTGISSTRTETAYITVYADPTANFTIDPAGGCAPLTVDFTDTSTNGTGNIVNWTWDFGDGNLSNLQNPNHTYVAAGRYDVTLVVEDEFGCSHTLRTPDAVNITEVATVDFTASTQTACAAPLTVDFTSSVNPAGTYTYVWDFGDGNGASTANPTHTYLASGDYTVSLTVIDINGCQEQVIKADFILINNPTAAFSSLDTAICTGQEIQFVNQSSGADGYVWAFGDGGTSTDQNPRYTYNTPGTYSVSLEANNSAGCGDIEGKSGYITVYPAPSPSFSASQNQSCINPLFVNFTDQSIGNIAAWDWNFGNGNISISQNPSTSYLNPGFYDVSLTVTTTDGCVATETRPNFIQIEEPVADFAVSRFEGCAPLDVSFADLSTSTVEPIVSWQWDFGDGNFSSLQSPTHQYTTEGIYTVSLTVTTASGCRATEIFQYISVGTRPTVDFTGTPQQVCIGDPVNFLSLATGNVDTWIWNFGQGNVSLAQPDVATSFLDTGFYDVLHIAVNNGCADTLFRPRYIEVIGPRADFAIVPNTACEPSTPISFLNQSVFATGYLWDFDDGNTSTDPNPTHVYGATGTYNIRLYATDSITGCTNEATDQLDILNPVAGFTVSGILGCGPYDVTFTNNSTDAATYEWDFGDGTTSTQASPIHTYAAPGNYVVRLIAFQNNCSDTLTQATNIQVTGPEPDFAANLLTGCAPLGVTFSDSTTPYAGTSIVAWIWDFGDGNTGSGPNPTHSYANPGQYTVSLTTIDSDGCQATISKTDYINPTFPTAAFSSNDSISCPGSVITFNNTSTGSGLSYLWGFGDGTTSNVPNPVHLYPGNGSYTVTLAATDVNGCTDVVFRTNYINVSQPTASFSADTTSATCPPLQVNFTDLSSPDVVTWYWDFGDGSTSSLPNPSKIYSVAGNFDVRLVVQTLQGCRDTLDFPSLIQIQGPSGAFTMNPLAGCNPLPVTFTAQSPNASWTYEWDFGDGTGAIGTSVTHTYSRDTTLLPLMLVRDGSGCVVPVQSANPLTIYPLPTPAFTPDQTLLCLGESVSFQNQSSSPRAIARFVWDFGTGDTSALTSPTYTYPDTGTFEVNLQVVTADGCSDTAASPVTITVSAPPTASFTPTPDEDCNPASISFIESSSGTFPIVDWRWQFGDGFLDSGQVIAPHTYTVDGVFNPSLTITDDRGCQSTSSRPITVNPLPAPDFEAFRYGCGPLAVSFTDRTSGSFPIVSWLWEFGDGNTSTAQNPTHFYAADGFYTVRLTVVDSKGCSRTETKTNYIQLQRPIANFTSNAGISCPPQTVTFTNQSVPDTTASYVWNFGDGSPISTDANPTHTYHTSDTFDVTLIVTNIFGCTDTFVRQQHVINQAPPTASLSLSDVTGCVPFNISMNSTSSAVAGASLTAYQWDYGTGTGGTAPVTSHLYTIPGSYTVSLEVTDNNGCRDTAYQNVFINPNPVADFQAGDTVGCAVQSIAFADLTSGTNAPVNWLWRFGDGSTGTAQNPTHTYFANGAYDVFLRVTDVNGCQDSIQKNNYIVLEQPVANFTTSASQACVGSVVTFTDASTGPFPTTSWIWDFGDGTPLTFQQNPTHAYSTPGTYHVTLISANALGCGDTVVKNSVIQVWTPPTASFTTNPTTGCDPLVVSFTDASSDGSGSVVSYLWDFGDGNGSTQQNPTYTYATPGVYTVMLTVTDDNGCTDQVTRTVESYEVPQVDFAVDQRRGCAPFTANFTDISTTPYVKVQWYWDFGDGNTSTSPAPTHTYLSDGDYTVKLIVVDNNGCRDSMVKVNHIQLGHPVADFSTSQNIVCPNSDVGVQFTDQTIHDTTIVNWAWQFGDGGTSTQQNPSYNYATGGTYQVILTVTDILGCTDSDTLSNSIQVRNVATTDFTISDSANCTPLAITFTDISVPGDGAIVGWRWDFGNGDSSFQQNPSYAWNTDGIYTVSLVTTDIFGCVTSDSTVVRALPLPTAEFTSPNRLGCAPQLVNFGDASTGAFPIAARIWSFGDGNVANNVLNPSNLYAVDSTYDVSLIVIDDNGCRDTMTKAGFVRLSHPVAQVSLTQNQVCPGVAATGLFTDQSMPDTTLVSWTWDFGDGNTSNLQNPTHAYAAPGLYDVTLTVENILGCTDIDTQLNAVEVLHAPNPQFTISNTADCTPLNVTFTDSSINGDGNITTWAWDFGDGNGSFLQNPTHIFAASGVYNVSLITTDDNGCRDSISQVVEAYPLPTPDFTVNNTVGCGGQTFTFTDLSGGAALITGWFWDFGDGSTSTLRNPAHTYLTEGSYTVSLTITDSRGCSETLTRNSYLVLTRPTAAFTQDQTRGCPGFTVNFTDTSVPDHPLTGWSWDFGDGASSNQQNPSHSYTIPGVYTVSLTVTNQFGCTDTYTATNLIEAVTGPTAQFSLSDTAGCAPLTINFSNTSVGNSSTINSVRWFFDNGDSALIDNPTMTYTNPGNYTVQLRVIDADGCEQVAYQAVTVYDGPSASFAAAPTAGCPPLAVSFANNSTGPAIISAYTWDFGDGNTSNGISPTHTYTTTDTFDVSLIATDLNGCRDTFSRAAYIKTIVPQAEFTLSTTNSCTGSDVTFTDASTSDTTLVRWTWDFGDGDTGTGQTTQHFYSTPGTYTVRLIVENSLGCTDTITKVDVIDVASRPIAAFSANDTADCPAVTFDFTNLSTQTTWPINGYAWDLGNGQASTATNPSATYATAGDYEVQLVVTDQNGCQDTATLTVTAYELPSADFFSPDSLGCAPQATDFVNNSTGAFPLTTYAWDFGDGNTSTQQNPTNLYTADGVYDVSLIITDQNGCQDTLVRSNYIVLRHPQAEFTASPTDICPGATVSFSEAVVPDTTILSYVWDFGDGSSGTGTNPSHTYTTPGTYDVQLVVINVLGCRDTLLKSNFVRVANQPVAAFSANDTADCAPVSFSFTNASSATTWPINDYTWDFGNGQTSSLTNPSTTYNTPGDYVVQLVVTDQNGCADTTSLTVTAYDLPTVSFFSPDTLGCAPQPTDFISTTGGPFPIASFAWDFGDGNSSSAQNPTHLYVADGRYDVRVIVTDINGCSDTTARNNYVWLRHPQADYTADQTAICPGTLVTFTETATPDTTLTNYFWDFGDGRIGTGATASHLYTTSGTYDVELIIENVLGCRDTIVKTNLIQVADHPIAAFSANDTADCAPVSFSFTNLSSATTWPIVNYDWDLGNGQTSTLTNPTATYSTPGDYVVQLVATDQNGCSDTSRLTVTAYDLPNVSFFSPDTLGCAPQATDFISATSGPFPIVSYVWDFGDGNTSTAQNPTHVYQADGQYEVSLVISDVNGCRDTIVRSNYIQLSHPQADFTAAPTDICPGTTVTFTEAAIPDTTLATYLWDFGDGNTGSGATVNHFYPNSGNYDVQLVIENVLGCRDTIIKTNLIQVPDHPIAAFSVNDTADCAPVSFSFTDLSTATTWPIVSYEWDLGNGQTSTLTNPTASYLTPGDYEVQLVVTDQNGCTDTTSLMVTAYELPTASFFSPDTLGCAPQATDFASTSNGPFPITGFAWDFGDGNTSTAQNPTHVYLADGRYDVSLVVTDLNGCRDTVERSNYIWLRHPQADFTTTATAICPGTNVVFAQSVTPDTTIVNYFWDFGDGTTGTGATTSHLYTTSGMYDVQLIVENVLGCRDTIVKANLVQVADHPLAAFSANDTADCAPVSFSFTDLSTATTWPIVSYAWDLGNGQTSTLTNPSASYFTPGDYDVQLVVTDQNGCTDTTSLTVTAYELPTASFFSPDTLGCAPQATDFVGTSTGAFPITGFAWDFGDGNTASIQNPTQVYLADGRYDVSLIVTDLNGCRDTMVRSNYIWLRHPQADFTSTQSAICPGTNVTFTEAVMPDTTITNYFWDFGDGNTGIGATVTHLYPTTGNYDVQLIVENVLGCRDTIVKTNLVQVADHPMAAFSANDTADCAPVSFSFSDISTATTWPIVSYEWDLGNGQTSTLTNPTATYSNPGDYEVQLVVTDQNGCTDTTRLTVTAYDLPAVSFFSPDTLGCAPRITSFVNTSTGTYPLAIFAWDFGDGNTSPAQNPTHTYLADGRYDVSLTVTDVNGCRNTLIESNYVRLTSPVADFGVSASEVCAGVEVNFTDNSVPDTTLTVWNWNFGDGTTGTGANITHAYATPGTYDVQLIITNVNGCQDTVVRTSVIRVLALPTANFITPDSAGCPPVFSNFQDLSVAGDYPITQWTWDFGNGSSSNAQNTNTLFANTGTYPVQLIVEDQAGCQDSVVRAVEVFQLPVANFTASDTLGCAENITFTDLTQTPYGIVAWQWDFGDGDSSQSASPTHTYLQTGSYTVSLITTDANGCQDTIVKPSYINVTRPIAAFAQDLDVICPGQEVQFADFSTPDFPIVDWEWNFGDGTVVQQQNPRHTFTAPGIYPVTLTITNSQGCTDTEVGQVEVLMPPTAQMLTSTAGGCAPITVDFRDASSISTAPLIAWYWDFGDGTIGNQQNVTHTYSQAGAYQVTLTIVDGNGCTDDTTFTVQVDGIPQLDFVADKRVGCAPEVIRFTNQVVGTAPIVNWQWNFGDGNSSTDENPQHTYANDGTYDVTLTVIDANGCSSTLTKPAFIRLNHPQVDFVYSTPQGCPDLTVNFAEAVIPDTTIAGYSWVFGDGNISSQPNPTHTYTTPGTYTVSLTVTNALGCVVTETKANAITVFQPPVAAFTPTNPSGCVPLTVTYFDSSTTAVPIATYAWDFGNGQTSSLKNPTVTFDDGATYPVSLTITDINGCTSSITHTTEGRPAPAPAFTVSDSLGCAPSTIRFFDQSQGLAQITAWLWDFGDGNTSTDEFPTHTYATNGTYTVSLTVTDIFGCSETLIKPDLIQLSPPAVDFVSDRDKVCPGDEIRFADLSSGLAQVVDWQWDFGDGNTATGPTPTHAYAQAGRYSVTLTITDDRGCSGTLTKDSLIEVYQAPVAAFNPTSIDGCMPLPVTFTNQTIPGSSPILNWDWQFGNGEQSIFTNPKVTFQNAGVYTVFLHVLDNHGCKDTTSMPIEVYRLPTANFLATDSFSCAPILIEFLDRTGLGDAPLAAWHWDFGDGNIDTTQFAENVYQNDGIYDVRLAVADRNGCRDTLRKPRYIRLSHPVADFTVSATQACPETNLSFIDQSIPDTTLVSWFWDFGDGATSSLANPVHAYDRGGLYTVSLTVTNAVGCSHTITQNQLIEIVDGPLANFTPSAVDDCAPFEVGLTDNSVGRSSPIVSWYWQFGTGDTSVARDPNYRFVQPGTYTVSLTVTDNTGCQSHFARDLTALRLPTANFLSIDTLGCAPSNVSFSDLSVGDRPITDWLWSFGDGSNSNQQSPTHTYQGVGTYDVQLIIADNRGCQDTVSKAEYVRLSNPIPLFTQDEVQGCPGLTVQFTDTSIADTTLISWLWDFGDGTTSIVQHPSHTYPNPGTYPVSLTVTNANGCDQTITKGNAVTVTHNPVADFLIPDTIDCTPFALDISDQTTVVSAPIVAWSWSFGNGDSSTVQEPNYSYTQAGIYTVSLRVEDGFGCVDSASQEVIATVSPTAYFDARDTVGCAPHTVAFNEGSGGPYDLLAWSWSFGDGQTSVAQQPTHTYTQDGNYTVELVVTDIQGCTDTLIRPAYIRLSHPVADFMPDVNTGCPGTSVTFTDQSLADTTLVGWAWNFGDGGQAFQQQPTHTYASAGTYDVTLTITNLLGCEDTMVYPRLIEITRPPVAIINASDTSFCRPSQVDFASFSRASAGIGLLEWFVDGVPSGQGPNFSFVFSQIKDYEVMLVVTDHNGCTDTTVQDIFLRPIPDVDFRVSDTLSCAPVLLSFFDETPHSLVRWEWDFGDGDTSSQQNPVHTYLEDGFYNVRLTVWDAFGCSGEVEKVNQVKLAHPDASFTVEYEVGCPPVEANFTAEASSLAGIAKYEWEFGDGNRTTRLEETVTYGYGTSGIYDVTLIVTDSAGCQTEVEQPQLVTVLGDVVPDPIEIHRVSVLTGDQIEVVFRPHQDDDFQEYTVYRLEPGQGFIPVYTSPYVFDTLFIDQVPSTENRTYCYKVAVTNYCGTESNMALTEQHCTVEASTTILPGQVLLRWTPYQGWTHGVNQYEIYTVDSYNPNDINFVGIVDGNTTRFADEVNDCFTDIAYRVRAIGTSALQTSWSDTTLAVSRLSTSAPPTRLLVATVENNEEVKVEWGEFSLTNPSLITIERSEDGAPFQTFATVEPDEEKYQDRDVQVSLHSYAYRVFAKDSCGNQSTPSNVGKTILLSVSRQDSGIRLDWNPYESWNFGVETYVIEVFDINAGSWRFVNTVPGTSTGYWDLVTQLDQTEYCYRVIARELGGNEKVSYSNEDCIDYEPNIFIPNAFTPNNDGSNDLFLAKGFLVQDFQMTIYSRWGTKVFETFSPDEGWDGTYQGQPAREGVYVVVIKFTGDDKRQRNLRGSVTLFR